MRIADRGTAFALNLNTNDGGNNLCSDSTAALSALKMLTSAGAESGQAVRWQSVSG